MTIFEALPPRRPSTSTFASTCHPEVAEEEEGVAEVFEGVAVDLEAGNEVAVEDDMETDT